jgi:hypothetical protein
VRIEGDADRFGMTGGAGFDHLVMGRALFAAGIARDRAGDALDVLEHALDAPEAAAGQNRRFQVAARGLVGDGGGDDMGRLGGLHIEAGGQCAQRDECLFHSGYSDLIRR